MNPEERVNQRKNFESLEFIKFNSKDCQTILLSVFDNFENADNEDDNADWLNSWYITNI